MPLYEGWVGGICSFNRLNHLGRHGYGLAVCSVRASLSDQNFHVNPAASTRTVSESCRGSEGQKHRRQCCRQRQKKDRRRNYVPPNVSRKDPEGYTSLDQNSRARKIPVPLPRQGGKGPEGRFVAADGGCT
eukprot:5135610-Pyramimonas_sp.AAC.1